MKRTIAELREVVTKLTKLLAGQNVQVTQQGTRAFVSFDERGQPKRVNIPMIPDNATDEFVCAIQGFIDHEIAHILFTQNDLFVKDDPELQSLLNIIEDTMIERLMGRKYPGAVYNLDKLHGFFISGITTPALAQVRGHNMKEFGILLVPLMRALSGQKVFETWLRDNGHLDQVLVRYVLDHLPADFAQRLKVITKTSQSLELAKELYAIVRPPAKKVPGGDGDDENADDGRDAEDFERTESEKQKKPRKNDDTDGEGGEGEDKGDPGKTDEPKDPEAEKDEEAGGAGDGEAKDDDAKGDSGSDGENESEGEDADAKPDKGKKDKPSKSKKGDPEAGDEADEDDGEGSGAGDDDADEMPGEDENDGADEAGKSDPSEEGEDEGSSGEKGDDEASGDGSDADGENEDEGEGDAGSGDAEDGSDEESVGTEDDGSDEGDGKAGGSSGADSGEDDGAQDAGGEPDATGQQDEVPSPSLEEGGEETSGDGSFGGGAIGTESPFEDGEFEMPSGKFAEDLSELISKMAADLNEDADYTVFTRDHDVLEKPEVRASQLPAISALLTKMDDENRQMTGVMQKDIERMMAARSNVMNVPGFRSGKLHSAGLHKLATEDDRVFRRKLVNTSKSTAVSLLCDLSGSMHGTDDTGHVTKIEVAIQAAMALGTTLERVGIANEILGFTTRHASYQYMSEVQAEVDRTGHVPSRVAPIRHALFKGFDERMTTEVKRRFAAEIGNGGHHANIDGESVEFAALRLLPRREQRKVLIVFSDGQPAGCQDPRAEVLKLKQTVRRVNDDWKIDTVGIGIMSRAVETFYPRHVVLNKVADLPKTVMGELKRILLS